MEGGGPLSWQLNFLSRLSNAGLRCRSWLAVANDNSTANLLLSKDESKLAAIEEFSLKAHCEKVRACLLDDDIMMFVRLTYQVT